MRILYGIFSAVTVLMVTGCGQTGALQLPSDPNYDKRPKYLIYKDSDRQAVETRVNVKPQNEQTTNSTQTLESEQPPR